jgi:serine/threonine protein kinase/Leucine-rich repeat (LRR) protein
MAIGLKEVVKQLTESSIIAQGKLDKFIPPQATPKDAEELAKELVKAGDLTEFQAQHILQGKTKALILGNYTILDKIGAGGMGQVFKAQHRRMQRVVAIKMLPPATTKDPMALARFQREVVAAAKLSHTNIVAAHDADEANGAHFLVMEYVEGKDLSALVKKNGPFPVSKAVNYILQAARGLEFAHRKGVIHRDIKPANLLLDADGTVKILDMGLARIESPGAAQAELTGTGAVMGTVDYMSPEQAFNTKHADARSDIYSLGCSLYYLIAGKATYGGETVVEKIFAHREKEIPSLKEAQPDVSDELQAIFAKMVAKKADDRYQTMNAVMADLEKFTSGQSTSLMSSPSSGVTLNEGAMTFLKSIQTTAPGDKTKVADQAARAKAGKKSNKTLIYGGVAAAALAIAAVAGVVISMRSGGDNLVVEVNEPDAVVTISNEQGKVETTRKSEKTPLVISVDPGKHRLKVEKNGFQFLTQDFTVESGDKVRLRARLVPVKAVASQSNKPWNTPAFQQWVKATQALPAEKQIEAVSKKLMELNPGFDGKLTGYDGSLAPKSDNGVLTELSVFTDNIIDLSPLRVLTGLRCLACRGSNIGTGKLADLSPLNGIGLTTLYCSNTQVSDLSPLKGMPLATLLCNNTPVSNLSPLHGMPLLYVEFNSTLVADLSPLHDCKRLNTLKIEKTKATFAAVAAVQKALPNCKIEWDDPSRTAAKRLAYLDPAFQKWVADTQKLPAEQQIEAVSKKLVELNPGFDGKWTDLEGKGPFNIVNGTVIALSLTTDEVTDISPVRALSALQILRCRGSASGKGKLIDLTPLTGLQLKLLDCAYTQVKELSPLRGMPLVNLFFSDTSISDLSALKDMKLVQLYCGGTKIVDLSPLRGMPLEALSCRHTQLTDLSPLRGMPLTFLECNHTLVSDLSAIADCTTLKSLSVLKTEVTAAQVAALQKALPNCKIEWDDPAKDAAKKLAYLDPAFHKWVADTQKLPAEQQLEAVSKKLMELNSGFDGKLIGYEGGGSPKVENKLVTEVGFITDDVTDISPVRALAALKKLDCKGKAKRTLFDLSPLQGMLLTHLTCYQTKVSDLSPLQRMKLKEVYVSDTLVMDLSPLQGMPLSILAFNRTKVSDLSSLAGMQLTILHCIDTQISDLSPLRGMPLAILECTGTRVSSLLPISGLPLVTLACNGVPVSDLSPLEVCKSLKKLDVRQTKVIAAQVAALQKALPNCKIEWDDPAKAKSSQTVGLSNVNQSPTVDLLALVDLAKHVLSGEWKNDAGGLVGVRATSGMSLLRIPYPLPDEYRLELVVERKTPGGSLNVFFASGGQQGTICLDAAAGANGTSALEQIDGKCAISRNLDR